VSSLRRGQGSAYVSWVLKVNMWTRDGNRTLYVLYSTCGTRLGQDIELISLLLPELPWYLFAVKCHADLCKLGIYSSRAGKYRFFEAALTANLLL